MLFLSFHNPALQTVGYLRDFIIVNASLICALEYRLKRTKLSMCPGKRAKK